MPKVFSESEARRAPLNLKTTKGLRDRIEKSAAVSGRALTHEIEHRIEQSFDLDREFGGREAHEIHHNLSKFLRLFQVRAFGGDTYLARAGLKAAFSRFVDSALSDGGKGLMGFDAPQEENPALRARVEKIGVEIANTVLLSSTLEHLAATVEARGEKAQRFGESLSDWAARTLLDADSTPNKGAAD